ncbi:MAG: hypothetical protein LBG77_00410 [Dysgonamonadaceae bacterium]|jgi:glycosyltransferase involved in cell wall biosynthesis|nr:hypothetical protein [Dysgonamonadaceae bacterium]
MLRIVIPCYNEAGILSVIANLFACERGDFPVEIIVVVNSYSISPEEIIRVNRLSYSQLEDFAKQHNQPSFRLTNVWIENLPGHQTGAGLPRKTGMDLAAQQFEPENRPDGIIVSLDADCTVSNNYLTAIYENFKLYKLKSATFQFHHPVEHLPPDDPLRKASEAYEEYLRYYRAALEFTGYPYAYYTIGSAFAVTAKTYRQAGGMGKQQAGEDFYFLQKVFPLGNTRFIDSVYVYPAARESDRVPFGTGPAISKMLNENQLQKYSYQVAAFSELKQFFMLSETFFKTPAAAVEAALSVLPVHLQNFLREDGFLQKIDEINRYTTTFDSYKKRFFNYFTAFKILKYLNFVHPEPYPFAAVREQFYLLK